MNNAENNGTVVRWATAYALAEILKLKTSQNKKLLPAIEQLSLKEKDNGVKKKYLDALKKSPEVRVRAKSEQKINKGKKNDK